MRFSKAVRLALATGVVASFVVAGVIAPSALGASKLKLVFLTQPQDTKVNATIRASDLNQAAAFIQVQLLDGTTPVTNKAVTVGFKLATGPGLATGSLQVIPQTTNASGIATFGPGTLSIGTENEPQFTKYRLVPITTKGAFITGDPSLGFNIWEDGESCTGVPNDPDRICEATLRGGGAEGEDRYTLDAAGTLGASELTSGELPGLVCARQRAIFPNSVFSYATTGTSTAVLLENHISRADWRASANNGQAHADWCIGLLTNTAWQNNGANSTRLDTDLDGDLDLWVALAPNCPVANPAASAPCIVNQNPDGDGGSIATGWLPAGDPPRRT